MSAARWQAITDGANRRPDTWCRGCGYFHVVHRKHRADCTATQPDAQEEEGTLLMLSEEQTLPMLSGILGARVVSNEQEPAA